MQGSPTNQLVESYSLNQFQLCDFDELTPDQLKSRKDFKLEEKYLNIHKTFMKIVPDKELRKKRPYSVLYLISPNKIVGFIILKYRTNLPNNFKQKLQLPTGTQALEVCFLAVDQDYRDRGFGETLLIEGISLAREFAAENPQCSILYLNAADEKSARFYDRQGLQRYQNSLVFVQSLL